MSTPTAIGPSVEPLSADVLLANVESCACPQCGAPMAVRLWLLTADCWRCDVSISLAHLWDDVAKDHAGPQRETKAPAVPERTATRRPRRSMGRATSGVDRRPALPVPPRFTQPRRLRWQTLLQEALACLMSTIAHLILLILLALLSLGGVREPVQQIRLSLEVDPTRREGGTPTPPVVVQQASFELPVERPPQPVDIEAQIWDRLVQDAAHDPGANLPEYAELEDSMASNNQYERMLSSRDPRIRREVVLQEGGTTRTEAAVARALRWIARHQARDGSWPLSRFHRTSECRGQCGNPGSISSDAGGTALALQAMLGAGQTHQVGQYRDEVSAGLRYLLEIQRRGGDLRGNSSANAGMYVHALATIALCDALAMTGDPLLRDPAQRAIDFVEIAQHDEGGWRYKPGQAGDLSVVGWQLMAIHSAKAAGLQVADRAFLGAEYFLNSVQTDRDGAFYSYLPGGKPTPAMTAEGLLSRMYLGWRKSHRGLRTGVAALADAYPPEPHDANIYYWYYATQVMHHWGGRTWASWNRQMRDILVGSQIVQGHEAGSWDPNTPHGHQGGRLYMTALACCTLEVYYRHAPIFRKIRLE